MSRTGSEIRQSEAQSKMIQDRITAIERHLGTLCDTLSSYTRKTARLRDKGDLLAKEIVNYAEYEKLNPTLKKGLTSFAEHLSAVQDYRQAEVQRLEAKSVNPLSNYGLLCKQTKNELKSAFSAHDREQAQRKKLVKIQQKHPSDQQQIRQAQTELQKASVDASRTEKALERQMETFESKKLQDIKKILSDFVNIEMIFHAKALEVYTQCYQSLSVIEPEYDLEVFNSQIHPDTDSRRLSLASSTPSHDSAEKLTPKSTPTSLRNEQTTSKQLQQTPPKSTQQQQSTNRQQQNSTNKPKQHQLMNSSPILNSTTSKSKVNTNSSNKQLPSPKLNHATDASPARKIIPVGTLKDESDDDDDFDEDDDDDDSEYDDDDDSDDYETTEASTVPNGKPKK